MKNKKATLSRKVRFAHFLSIAIAVMLITTPVISSTAIAATTDNGNNQRIERIVTSKGAIASIKATFTYQNLSIELIDGYCKLITPTGEYKLTDRFVTGNVYFDTDTGTVYIVTRSRALGICNYEIEGSSVSLHLIKDVTVTEVAVEGTGESTRITGYTTSTGKQKLFTFDEVKSIVKGSQQPTEPSQKPTEPQKPTDPSQQPTQPTEPTQKPTEPTNPSEQPSNLPKLEIVDGHKLIYSATGGITYTISTNKAILKKGLDSNKTAWYLFVNKDLYAWNPSVVDSCGKPIPVKVAAKCYDLNLDTSVKPEKATGYFDSKGDFHPLLSAAKLQAKANAAAAAAVKKDLKLVVKGTVHYVYDTKGKLAGKRTLKNGTLIYNKMKYKNVKTARFTRKYELLGISNKDKKGYETVFLIAKNGKKAKVLNYGKKVRFFYDDDSLPYKYSIVKKGKRKYYKV